jgi:hypothetical protein
MISRQERIDMACEAEHFIAEAIENLKGAVRGLPCENRHRAYLICQLEVAIGAGGWASADSTVGDLITDIETEAEDDDTPLSAVIAARLEKAGYTVKINGDWLDVIGAEEKADCMTVWDAAGRTIPRRFFAPTADGVNICLAYCG